MRQLHKYMRQLSVKLQVLRLQMLIVVCRALVGFVCAVILF